MRDAVEAVLPLLIDESLLPKQSLAPTVTFVATKKPTSAPSVSTKKPTMSPSAPPTFIKDAPQPELTTVSPTVKAIAAAPTSAPTKEDWVLGRSEYDVYMEMQALLDANNKTFEIGLRR